jgi:serine/threonine protein kinase
LIGKILDSKYELVARLGRGGFGVVYRARRLHLAREVAIKVLNREYSEDKIALKRFRLEAFAASKLNHPNVVTIYDLGEPRGTIPAYIVMELIEGESLRAILQRVGRLNPESATEIARQICAGVGAAHRSNIVHRDLKPDNVILLPANEDRERETVKVVDFGLAKLRDVTSISMLTESGVVVGTPYYMSPEQCRGETLDARSDVYSIGALLYELLCGKPPFTAPSVTGVIAKHLTEEPPQLSSDLKIPPSLEAAIRRALAKEPDARQENANALAVELERGPGVSSTNTPVVSQPHQLNNVAEPLREPEKRSALPYPLSGGVSTQVQGSGVPPVAGQVAVPHPKTQSTPLERYRRPVLFSALLLFGILTALGIDNWRRRQTPSSVTSVVPFQKMRLSRLTSSGKARDAAISPDGKYVAYKIEDEGRRSLWVHQILPNTAMQLVPPSDAEYWGLTFSPDGNYIFYLKLSSRDLGGMISVENQRPQLYQISVLGGVPKKVMDNVTTPITFSPDGSEFAFVRDYANEGERALVVVNTESRNERKLASKRLPDFFGYEPSWSPDGKMIACPAGTYKEHFYTKVVGIMVADGTEKELSREWDQVRQLAWFSDNSGLAVIAREEGTLPRQIWLVSYPGGIATRATNDLNDYIGVSISKDANSLITVQSEHINNLWVAPSSDIHRARQITADSDDARFGLAWTHDNRIVYSSGAGGNQDLWIINADGTNGKQLTLNKGINYYPCVTPDSQTIAFASNRTGPFYIWSMSIDGSDVRQLVLSGQSENIPACSPDGKWVVYAAYDSGSESIWKIPVEGGLPIQITPKYSGLPIVSPDGKVIACTYREDEKSAEVIGIINFEGGMLVNKVALPGSAPTPPLFRWMPDGEGITYVDESNGAANIWNKPIDGRPRKALTDLGPGRISSFAWSPDGAFIAYAHGADRNNVVLISNLK